MTLTVANDGIVCPADAVVEGIAIGDVVDPSMAYQIGGVDVMAPGEELSSEVLKSLEEVDSYNDVAVFAIKSSRKEISRLSDRELSKFDGRGYRLKHEEIESLPDLIPVSKEDIIDLTDLVEEDGKLEWLAPEGKWQVIRLGYASNFQMIRPCPGSSVGLECDRLNKDGINTHFENHLKPILDAAGGKTGRTLKYIHIDSWEAHGQNWTEGFLEEFNKRRGYSIQPWLPVLTGFQVENAEMTSRFFWDMRLTVNELMLENYIDRLKELIAPYDVAFSCESYGTFGVDNLTYGGRSDLPVAEFWTKGIYDIIRDNEKPEVLMQFFEPAVKDLRTYNTVKGLASVANTYGRPRLGAEAFTGSLAWGNHPWLIKGIGDEAYANGVNHNIFHLFAHQAYDDMVPGL